MDQLLGRDCGEQVMIAFNCCDKKFKCSIVAKILPILTALGLRSFGAKARAARFVPP